MLKLRCVAIDDEPLALVKMETFIKKVPYLEYEGGFDSAIKALERIKFIKPDLVFLDVQMKDLTGIQFIESLKTHPFIILTTAFEAYAVKAFELDVADYLLKPISFDRFLKAVEKVYTEVLAQLQPEPKLAVEHEVDEGFVFVKSGIKYVKIRLDSILYVEGMKDYLIIATTNSSIQTSYNFSSIYEVLPQQQFLRVHKSYVVALNKVDYIEKNYLVVKGKHIPISESYKEAFQRIIQQRGGKTL
jgi:DNA-binding LytR/AlgR family response regulator